MLTMDNFNQAAAECSARHSMLTQSALHQATCNNVRLNDGNSVKNHVIASLIRKMCTHLARISCGTPIRYLLNANSFRHGAAKEIPNFFSPNGTFRAARDIASDYRLMKCVD